MLFSQKYFLVRLRALHRLTCRTYTLYISQSFARYSVIAFSFRLWCLQRRISAGKRYWYVELTSMFILPLDLGNYFGTCLLAYSLCSNITSNFNSHDLSTLTPYRNGQSYWVFQIEFHTLFWYFEHSQVFYHLEVSICD